MKLWLRRFKFDGQRLILRNLSFQFFSIIMPTGFYLLFTKVMVTGNVSASFNVKYMGNMMVYSGMVNALFGLALFLLRDREAGMFQWCRLTPAGIWPYYFSIGCWSLVMNAVSVVVLGSVAVIFNHVALSAVQWATIGTVAVLGQLPILTLGVLISLVSRTETLSMLSNLIAFPMAIISGLWWPMGGLPKWVQAVGKLMPTYFINDWLGQIATHGTLLITDILGIGTWLAIMLVAVFVGIRLLLKRSDGVVRA